MTWVDVVCAGCDTTFRKETREYQRQQRRGRTAFYCTLRCHAEHQHRQGAFLVDATRLRVLAPNRKDHLSPFRWFMQSVRTCIRHQPRKGPTDLTPEYLQGLWGSQQGTCPFTGWALDLPETSLKWRSQTPRRASLDRIDNALGYVRGNVRFVAVMANFARQTFSDEELVIFCKAVAAQR